MGKFVEMNGFYKYLLISILFVLFLGASNPDSLISLIDTTQVNEKQAEIHVQLSEYYQNSDVNLSLDYAIQALEIAQSIHSKPLIAKSTLLMGLAYDYLGMSEKAMELLQSAVKDFREMEDKENQGIAIKTIGNLFWYSNKYETAIQYYLELYELTIETEDHERNIKALISIGLTYKNMGEYDNAVQYLDEAIKKAEEFQDNALIGLSLLNLANVYYENGTYSRALNICLSIENNYLEYLDNNTMPQFYNTLPQVYIKLGQFEKAEIYLEKAYKEAKKSGVLYDMHRYYFAKFELDSIRGDYSAALVSLSLYHSYQDSISNQSFENKLANYQSILDLEKKEIEIEKLQSQNQLKDLRIRQNKLIILGAMILIALMIIIITQSIRSIWRKNKTNKLLEEQKRELESQKEEISATLDKLKLTQKQLLQSEKMASLGVLSAGLAHEINNPLNFIKGGVNGLEIYYETQQIKPPELSTLLGAINEGIERASKIVKSLNHFSRDGSSEIEACHIHNIIDNCLVILHNQLKDKIEIKKQYEEEEIIISGNESRLHQVFMNILSNAEQSIEDKGKIKIQTIKEENNVHVLITDDGLGIEMENIKKITDPFYTTKEPGKGTGLGLSITYQIINEMHGNIEFKSEKGNGTTVIISIPKNYKNV